MEDIEVKIVKSKRKSLSIAIQPDGNLFVKAPVFMTDEEIIRWVKTKTGWISRNRQKVLKGQENNPPKKYVTGEWFWYRGQKYELEVRISAGRAGMVGIDGEKLILFAQNGEGAEVQKILEEWYVRQAKVVIPKRVCFWAGQMQESYHKITIKNQKRRWGSCSSARNLNFNWRLVMMPEAVLDYVVVHELCHLRQMNHSEKFWKEVEKVLPDYKVQKKWLEKNGTELK